MNVQIVEGVYWVGVIDWNVRNFHGYTYTTPRGTTYNAYLIVDRKIALVDTVAPGFADEMIRRIRSLVDPAEIDYVIANHGEIDHSGAIPDIMSIAPRAKLVCSRRGEESIGRYHPGDWEVTVVKTGDEIALGQKTLSFIEAPMLHWPDSMFTYIKEDALLMPNDAFGQHMATSERFADEVDEGVLFDEATKYYANILLPFSSLILKKVEEVQGMGLKLDVIAPGHGLIWRDNPMRIVEAYVRWAKGETKPRVVVVYETMWDSTEKIARAIVEGIAGRGVEVALYGLPMTDHTEVIKGLLEAKGILVGSSTHNRRMLLNIAAFMEDLKGLKPIGRIGAAFGSYGWGGGAVAQLEENLREAGIEVVQDGLALKYAPTEEELQQAAEFGSMFAEKVRSSMT